MIHHEHPHDDQGLLITTGPTARSEEVVGAAVRARMRPGDTSPETPTARRELALQREASAETSERTTTSKVRDA